MSANSTSSLLLAKKIAVSALLASVLAAPAFAQATSSQMKGLELSNDQPIQIESDKLEIKEPKAWPSLPAM